MGDPASGSVHIPWYATGFRADGLEAALAEIAPVAMRYGASAYGLHRSRDDRHRFSQMARFPDKVSWERYWFGPEFVTWRGQHSSWFQVPVQYEWYDVVLEGALAAQPAAAS